MDYRKQPTEPIFYDAYSIADAVVRQQDQQTRMDKAIATDGPISNKVGKLSNDIVRLQILIEQRIAKWVVDHGTVMVWSQYLDGHPHASKVRG